MTMTFNESRIFELIGRQTIEILLLREEAAKLRIENETFKRTSATVKEEIIRITAELELIKAENQTHLERGQAAGQS